MSTPIPNGQALFHNNKKSPKQIGTFFWLKISSTLEKEKIIVLLLVNVLLPTVTLLLALVIEVLSLVIEVLPLVTLLLLLVIEVLTLVIDGKLQ